MMVMLLPVVSGCGQSDKAQKGPGVGFDGRPASRAESSIAFEDVAQRCGIQFVPGNGQEAGRFTILESLGTGAAICDFDGDSLPDIILPGGGTFDSRGKPVGSESGVFRQQSSLQFKDVAGLCGIDTEAGYTHGVAVGDWDNDGFDDVVITGYGRVWMFQNAGDGTFIDVTVETGVRQGAWSTSAAFLDTDNDGSLELYIVNYVDWRWDDHRECIMNGHRDVCPPGDFEAQSDHLYRNNRDGTFTEASRSAGLLEGGKGLAVISGDVDLDGDTDIYVANDTTPNFLYLNDGAGVFEEQALLSGCALGATAESEGSMGVALADFNADGYPDIWVSNYENQSFAMYQSRGPGIFQHVSSITGISSVGQLYVGFGTAAFDADLDGDEDIFAANGHVMHKARNAPISQLPLVYENISGNRFRNVADSSGDYGRSTHLGRGVAAGDLDQDGLVDLVVSHTNEQIAVLKNVCRTDAAWVSVELIGRNANRSAIGAYVTIVGQKQPRLRVGGGSYLSESSSVLAWGLSTAETQSIEVHWPSGKSQAAMVRPGSTNVVIELEGF